MKEAFERHSFYGRSLEVIRQANAIIAHYQARGLKLTVRQLYYQFVSRDLIPNRMNEYKRLVQIVNKARLAGLIDWDAIEDRTRWLRAPQISHSPDSWLETYLNGYKEDVWRDQAFYVEVWIEKDALSGVIEDVCNRWRVPYFPCRGYSSQSEMYEAGKRLQWMANIGKQVRVLHLGDHDPSGIDMTRDNSERLRMFSNSDIQLNRLALNMDQIEEYDPPANPAKDTDSRFADYTEQFGDECWELDALDPTVIQELIEAAIADVCDSEKLQHNLRLEEQSRTQLRRISENWDLVNDFLNYVDDENKSS